METTGVWDAALNRSLAWRLQGPDYAALLPALAALPLPLAFAGARLRGQMQARGARDWAELALGTPFVRERTAQAMQEMLQCPADSPAVRQGVADRYCALAQDELHACLIAAGRLQTLPLDLGGVKALLAAREPRRGLVVVTAHFDSVLLGTLGLGLSGATTHVMTSSVIEDDRVHPAVRQFFRLKYERATAYLNGGGFHHAETSMRTFYRALQRGDVAAVVADAPAAGPDGPGTWTPWFGRDRRLADGALRMAVGTGSQMAALLTLRGHDGIQRWLCSPLQDPGHGRHDDESATQAWHRLFAFIESAIRQHPGRWWAAHLLPACPVREEARSV